jgi:hypothetical protein
VSNKVPDPSEQEPPAADARGRPETLEPSRLQELRVRRDSPAAGRDAFVMLVSQLQQHLVAELGQQLDVSDPVQARATIQERLDKILAGEKLILNRNEKRQVVEAILRDLTPDSGANGL